MSKQPPDLEDLRAQRDAGRFGAGGPFPNSGFNSGCNGCVVIPAVIALAVGLSLALSVVVGG
ncbi:MAG TPA: hypothetical protein VJQ83_04855 [Tepidiformaceae bacterium]|nr:hypothetical protein [Tepidiformaceae bacterium]